MCKSEDKDLHTGGAKLELKLRAQGFRCPFPSYGVLRSELTRPTMPNPVAVFNTSMGTMKAEIYLDRVPRTAYNSPHNPRHFSPIGLQARENVYVRIREFLVPKAV